MFDVVALGELLIDFTPYGTSANGYPLFERNPGGAPANVLTTLAKLGADVAFIGKVGDDQFGKFLKNCLQKNRIDTSGLKTSPDVSTTLAFVHLTDDGDRSFSFYRNPGADMMLMSEDVPVDIIKSSRIFHFGSISLTDEPSRSATLNALKLAKENQLIISYDPNLRPPLWKSIKEAEGEIKRGLVYADVLKISWEELVFITKEKDLDIGTKILEDLGISLIFVTLGAAGTYYRYQGKTGKLHTYDVKVVDTTGAGDAFLGGILYKLRGLSLEDLKTLTIAEVEDLVDFGNAVGALTTTKKGATPAVPSIEEVVYCIKNISKIEP
ncbi:carbohydrate kinase family protein [Clostridium formicaceticum]|uniref:5-dehydro-2-deoxygluconokinase n=1 Tax=Clostridium formicaceticum TaxID=1497 RepID=A0AAC9WHJ4_9CLOT|nr:carbohydrate kinase [Clostridium formicaceticum]AOY74494.1 carbohydrate kinase [Clostridium formicaceticum]ARE88844.1 5-dehydro-2-deoxygluconokinase [Clostridium formicaceticum]